MNIQQYLKVYRNVLQFYWHNMIFELNLNTHRLLLLISFTLKIVFSSGQIHGYKYARFVNLVCQLTEIESISYVKMKNNFRYLETL